MKKIIAVWIKTPSEDIYDMEMRVIYSNHKRFKQGTRFDFGFLDIASREGYIIEIFPLQ